MELLNAEQFQPQDTNNPPSVALFLELPADIREHLDQNILPLETEGQRYNALRDWAFAEFHEDYEYDPYFTSSLSELGRSGRVNCFSFSNMFVAAARYVGVQAEFQLVKSQPQWDISGRTVVISQHINVTGVVKRTIPESERKQRATQQPDTGSRIRRGPRPRSAFRYVLDLNPDINSGSYHSAQISDASALSLFYSNRSAEALLNKDLETAYKFGRLAILTDDTSPTAWNNLGFLLSRDKQPEQAKQAYRTALRIDPNYESAASNLERIYRRMGETEEADILAQRIITDRRKNPYYHYSIGENKLAAGELNDALESFEDAIGRKKDEQLFYYALAETQIKLAQYKKAKKSLKVAEKYSTNKYLGRYYQLILELEAAVD